jgi:hypothetical protein
LELADKSGPESILWFSEKHHYEDWGWTRGQGAEKSSFDDVADPMDAQALREHFKAEAEALSKLEGKIKTTQSYLGTPHEQTKLPDYMKKHGLTPEESHGAGNEGEDEEAA